KSEAGKILAVEERDLVFARMRQRIIGNVVLCGGIFRKCRSEAKEGNDEFHPRRLGRRNFFGKRIQTLLPSSSVRQVSNCRSRPTCLRESVSTELPIISGWMAWECCNALAMWMTPARQISSVPQRWG